MITHTFKKDNQCLKTTLSSTLLFISFHVNEPLAKHIPSFNTPYSGCIFYTLCPSQEFFHGNFRSLSPKGKSAAEECTLYALWPISTLILVTFLKKFYHHIFALLWALQCVHTHCTQDLFFYSFFFLYLIQGTYTKLMTVTCETREKEVGSNVIPLPKVCQHAYTLCTSP